MRRLTVVFSIALCASLLLNNGCSRYTEEYWRSMDLQKQKLLGPEGQVDRAEYQLDRGVAEAFQMLMQTIPPSDRRVKMWGIFRPLRFYDELWRVGFVEATTPGVESSKLEDYVAEKTVILARMDRDFNRYFEMTERSRPADVLRDLNLQSGGMPDAAALSQWGKLHKLDVIVTGATSVSPGMIDISLKLEHLMSGRVVAVGSSKVPRSGVVDQMLGEPAKATEAPSK